MSSSDTLKILYFASLGETLGTSEEVFQQAPLPNTVSELIDRLSTRGMHWQKALGDASTRCAVNQVLAKKTSALCGGDEVAFFPPVTGG